VTTYFPLSISHWTHLYLWILRNHFQWRYLIIMVKLNKITLKYCYFTADYSRLLVFFLFFEYDHTNYEWNIFHKRKYIVRPYKLIWYADHPRIMFLLYFNRNFILHHGKQPTNILNPRLYIVDICKRSSTQKLKSKIWKTYNNRDTLNWTY
jgi:hypothetical protein